MFGDPTLTCQILEYEGYFDNRTRDQKIEDIIEAFAGHPYDAEHLREALRIHHLTDVSQREIDYIIAEINDRVSV